MKKIVLLGASFETTNRGVSALSAASSKLLHKYIRGCELTLIFSARTSYFEKKIYSDDGTINVRLINYVRGFSKGIGKSLVAVYLLSIFAKMMPIKALRKKVVWCSPVLVAIDESDFVADIFAGDSFSDIYGLSRLLSSCLLRLCVVNLRKKYILLPQTYGPYKTFFARMLSKRLLKYSTLILNRTESGDFPGILKTPVYCPDVAFELDPREISSKLTFEFKNDNIIVGLNISGLLYNGGYNHSNMFGLNLDYSELVEEIVSYFLGLNKVTLVLVPHTYSLNEADDIENDLAACSAVAQKNLIGNDRMFIVNADLDQHEIKSVIGKCDFFIGSRLHACIAALSQGIPAIGIAYSKKFFEMYKTMSIEQMVIDARTCTKSNALGQVQDLFEQREILKNSVSRRVSLVKKKIAESFTLLAEKT